MEPVQSSCQRDASVENSREFEAFGSSANSKLREFEENSRIPSVNGVSEASDREQASSNFHESVSRSFSWSKVVFN